MALCDLLDQTLQASAVDEVDFFNATVLVKALVDGIRRKEAEDKIPLLKCDKRAPDFIMRSCDLFEAAEVMGLIEIPHKKVLAKIPGRGITIGITSDILVHNIFLMEFASWLFPPWRFYSKEVTAQCNHNLWLLNYNVPVLFKGLDWIWS